MEYKLKIHFNLLFFTEIVRVILQLQGQLMRDTGQKVA